MNLYDNFYQLEKDVEAVAEQLEQQQQRYTARAREIKAEAERHRKGFSLYFVLIMSTLLLVSLLTGHHLLGMVFALTWILNDADDYFMIFYPSANKKLHTSECGWMYSEVDAKELESNFQEVKATKAKLQEVRTQSWAAEKELVLLLQKHLPDMDLSKLPRDAQINLKPYLAYYVEDMLRVDDEEEEDDLKLETRQSPGGEERY